MRSETQIESVLRSSEERWYCNKCNKGKISEYCGHDSDVRISRRRHALCRRVHGSLSARPQFIIGRTSCGDIRAAGIANAFRVCKSGIVPR